jgi:hypothetical protein
MSGRRGKIPGRERPSTYSREENVVDPVGGVVQANNSGVGERGGLGRRAGAGITIQIFTP